MGGSSPPSAVRFSAAMPCKIAVRCTGFAIPRTPCKSASVKYNNICPSIAIDLNVSWSAGKCTTSRNHVSTWRFNQERTLAPRRTSASPIPSPGPWTASVTAASGAVATVAWAEVLGKSSDVCLRKKVPSGRTKNTSIGPCWCKSVRQLGDGSTNVRVSEHAMTAASNEVSPTAAAWATAVATAAQSGALLMPELSERSGMPAAAAEEDTKTPPETATNTTPKCCDTAGVPGLCRAVRWASRWPSASA